MMAKVFGPRMGLNQHEKQQWNEAMLQLNITDKDLMTRLHNEMFKAISSYQTNAMLKVLATIFGSTFLGGLG